ncbi:hypothetical protein Bca4012_033328 [Brassica carinata]
MNGFKPHGIAVKISGETGEILEILEDKEGNTMKYVKMEIYGLGLLSEEEVLTKSVRLAREWLHAQEPKQGVNPQRTPAPIVRPPNCSIMNADAAWKTTTKVAGFGWTLRDSIGTSVSSSHTGYERFVGSALAAEGLAMRAALTKCKEKGVKRVICESDSSQLIKAINSGSWKPEIYGIVADICELASSFDVINFFWIPTERNTIADSLAKQCLLEVEAFMAVT